MATQTVDTGIIRTLPKDYESKLQDLSQFFTAKDNLDLFYFGTDSKDHDEYPHIDLIDAQDGVTVLANKRIAYASIDKLASLQEGVIKEIEDEQTDEAFYSYDITEVKAIVRKGQLMNP